MILFTSMPERLPISACRKNCGAAGDIGKQLIPIRKSHPPRSDSNELTMLLVSDLSNLAGGMTVTPHERSNDDESTYRSNNECRTNQGHRLCWVLFPEVRRVSQLTDGTLQPRSALRLRRKACLRPCCTLDVLAAITLRSSREIGQERRLI